MKHVLALPMLFLAVSGCGGAGVALDPDQRQLIEQRVEKYLRSLHTGDGDAIAAMTNPRILIKIGGADAIRRMVVQGSKRLRGMGVLVESVTFPRPPELVRSQASEQRLFAIVRTSTIVTSKGANRQELMDFMVGIKEGEPGTWTFIEGEKARQGALRDLYPDFPGDYQLPAKSIRSL